LNAEKQALPERGLIGREKRKAVEEFPQLNTEKNAIPERGRASLQTSSENADRETDQPNTGAREHQGAETDHDGLRQLEIGEMFVVLHGHYQPCRPVAEISMVKPEP
jgi:hypothetical protein